MKIKEHIFLIKVKSRSKRKLAEIALLASFASRKPDGMLFQLVKKPPIKAIVQAMRQSL